MKTYALILTSLLAVLPFPGGLLAAEAATHQVIDIWPEGVPDIKPDAGPDKEERPGTFSAIHHPTMVVYAPPAGVTKADTAVVFCAGGGYVHVAVGVDGGGVTKWLNSLGITVFVLKYRSVEYGHPAPLRDVLRAMRIVRSRAAEFGIKADHIGVIGGSAGGHLTASAGTLYDAPEGRTGAEIDKVSARPDFLVMIFPVVTMEEPYVHKASRTALLGPNPSEELKKHLSVELQVTKDTSPTFLVHSTADNTVPVESNPTVLTTRERIILRRARGSVSVRSNRVQCRTMPI